MNNSSKQATLYRFEISGYFFMGDKRIRFSEEVWAEDNVKAMEMVIGKWAWQASVESEDFRLDVIHYD